MDEPIPPKDNEVNDANRELNDWIVYLSKVIDSPDEHLKMAE